jgi:hypothetical protein
MEHEGMVHALSEIRRVLVPDGILIDLRPFSDEWRIEVFSARETRETGHVTPLPEGIADDEAASQAMADVESRGWFKRENEIYFPIHYVWDAASEAEKWIEEEWEGVATLGEETRRATRSAWALGDADSQVRVKVKMLITRWKVMKE